MSASIYYRYKHPEMHIDVAAPSYFIDVMSRVFGGAYPWTLTAHDIPRLEVLAAVNVDGAPKNPFTAIIDAMVDTDNGKIRPIELWPEY
jgi:hypothetical protein